MSTVIPTPDAQRIREEFSTLLLLAQTTEVTDKGTHGEAQEILLGLSAAKKRVEEKLNPIIDSAHRVHKSLTQMRAELINPIDSARKGLSNRIIDYEEIEKRRIANECARLEAEARKQEEERILAEASRYEKAGDREMAQAVLSQEITAPPVHVETELAEVNGSSTRSTWKGEVLDVLAFVRFVAEHSEYLSCITFSASALNAIAKSQKNMCRIPGFRAVEEKSKVTRESSRKF